MKKKEICYICENNKEEKVEFVSIAAHVKMKHKMSMEDYEKSTITVEETIIDEDSEEKLITNPKEIKESIFKDSIIKQDLSETIEDYLNKKEITLDELNSLVRGFKGGKRETVTQSIKHDIDIGNKGAEDLQHLDKVETTNLHIAEALTTKHDFLCVTVRHGPPKTWVLKKG